MAAMAGASKIGSRPQVISFGKQGRGSKKVIKDHQPLILLSSGGRAPITMNKVRASMKKNKEKNG